jgi:hypothetical protein
MSGAFLSQVEGFCDTPSLVAPVFGQQGLAGRAVCRASAMSGRTRPCS